MLVIDQRTTLGLRPNGVCGPMEQDVQAPEMVTGRTVDVGLTLALEGLPTPCQRDLQSTEQRSLGTDDSILGGILPLLPQLSE